MPGGHLELGPWGRGCKRVAVRRTENDSPDVSDTREPGGPAHRRRRGSRAGVRGRRAGRRGVRGRARNLRHRGTPHPPPATDQNPP
ncbi:MAG TPA: hypothetical protein DCF71_04090, partial [Gemmatimonadetes bacterium]|nr:hypothetical protein [Gemmatimonadota bacterium]